jgi:membrane peptidoglycan carboxypeptidase
VYASDGRTLIARFDTDPRAACLQVPRNDWGFFCDYLVTWWQQQPAFGSEPGERLRRLREGGYRIRASLDSGLQAAAHEHTATQLPDTDPHVLSLVSVEPGTGRVLAMAVNRRFRQPPSPSPTRRDPDGNPIRVAVNTYPDTVAPLATGGPDFFGYSAGSTFMMFTVVAALEKGIPLAHRIDTQPVYVSGYPVDPSSSGACQKNHYCPRNVGDPAYLSGPRTMWDALAHAVVTYFVPLQEQVGADAVVDVAQRLGIQLRSPVDMSHGESPTSRSWGSFTLGPSATTALDLANAYATLAADGMRCEPLPVREITDSRGVSVTAAQPRCMRAVTPEVARAALDAGRCAIGDRSAFGDRCGGAAPAAAVRTTVDRPISGQFGITDNGWSAALVVTAPQLSTAVIAGGGYCSGCHPLGQNGAAIVTTAAAEAERDGLANLPERDFPAPPPQLATG